MPVSHVPSIAPRNNATAQLRRRTNQNVDAITQTQEDLTTAQGSISELQGQLTEGFTGVIALAKLTGGGTNGSITVTSGIITAVVEPT